MESNFKLGPIDLLIIQGSPFCNIACTYCYLPDKHITKKISIDVINKIFQRIVESKLIQKELTIVWHAGEPLAVPITHYQKIFEEIEKARPEGISFSHAFQTNATLLNQEWCNFIKKNKINIGVSIDGPKFVHDKFRIKRNGKGSFDDAMRGIGYLKQNGVDFHVIAVVTESSLDHPDEIFNFFLEMGINRLGFNIEETEGSNIASTINQKLHERIKVFLQRMFELQKKADGKIIIREFEAAFNKILGNPFLIENVVNKTIPNSHLNVPYGIISVDCEGNFTTFSPELLGQKSKDYNDFVLGNVNEESFIDVTSSSKFMNIYGDIEEGRRMCSQSCDYYKLCGGGAPSNKYYENGTFRSTETLSCKYSIKMPIDIVLNDIEENIMYSKTA